MNDLRLAIQVHIYYPNVFWKQIEPRLSNFKHDFDLYISMTGPFDKDKEKEKILNKYPNANICVVKNLGEVARGFFTSLETILEKEYDYVLKVHTKHEVSWLDKLLSSVLPDNTKELFDAFEHKYGLISRGDYFRMYRNLLSNKHLKPMVKKCNCNTVTTNHFSGAIFWIKFSILKKYFGNGEITGEYFDEPYCRWGSKQHAAEFLYTCIVCDSKEEIGKLQSTKKTVAFPQKLATTRNTNVITAHKVAKVSSKRIIPHASGRIRIY